LKPVGRLVIDCCPMASACAPPAAPFALPDIVLLETNLERQ